MVTHIDSRDSLLSEIKQPREFGAARSVVFKTILVTIVGTDRGNLILDYGVYPIAFIAKDVETDNKFLVKVNKNNNDSDSKTYEFLKEMFEGNEDYVECSNAQSLLESVLADEKFKVQ